MAQRKPKPRPKRNSNRATQKFDLLGMVKDIASLKSGKLGWKLGLAVLATVSAFFYGEIRHLEGKLEGKIGEVETRLMAEISEVETRLMAEINEVRTIAIRTEAKVDALLKLNLAQHDGDNATIEETSDPLGDSPLGDSPIDASSDAPTASPTITTTQDNLPL